MTKKVRLKISSLAPLGDGVSVDNGLFYYVPGAIPGDIVEAEIIKRNKRDIYTGLLHLIEHSPHRRIPDCPVFSRCGGCTLLHAKEAIQREAKQQALMRQFDQQSVELVTAGPSLGYRRLARLHAKKDKNDTVQLGFYQRRAHRIADISHCPILEPEISNILPVLKNGMLKGLNEATLRISTGKDGVYLHVETDTPPEPKFYMEAEQAVPEKLKGIVLQWDGMTSVVAGSDTLSIDTANGEAPLRLPVGSFGQANPHINSLLVATVNRWVKESGVDQMLELFAGAGNFSFELRHFLKHLTLVELDPVACKTARQNFQNISGTRVVCEDAATAYRQIGHKFPLVLLDPPRTGAKEVCETMAANQHAAVIYVSCFPATLKRDIAYLQKTGYHLEELIGFDMFPQTAHLEAAAYLKKKS